MACPACDHSMQNIAENMFWCPRCGTIKLPGGQSDQPMLVGRAKSLLSEMVWLRSQEPRPAEDYIDKARELGIHESCMKAEERWQYGG